MCSNLYRLTLSYLPSARPIEVKTKTKNFHHRPLQVTLLGNSFFFLIYFLKTPYMSIIFTSLSTVLHQSLCWEILQDIIKLHQKKEILICLKKIQVFEKLSEYQEMILFICFLPHSNGKNRGITRSWYFMSVMLPFGKLKQEDHCEYKGSLGYLVNYRPAKATE